MPFYKHLLLADNIVVSQNGLLRFKVQNIITPKKVTNSCIAKA